MCCSMDSRRHGGNGATSSGRLWTLACAWSLHYRGLSIVAPARRANDALKRSVGNQHVLKGTPDAKWLYGETECQLTPSSIVQSRRNPRLARELELGVS